MHLDTEVLKKVTNKENLKEKLLELWSSIDTEITKKLIQSMPRRLEAEGENPGGGQGPSTNHTRGLAARRLFRVPPCRKGTIHLQTSMSSPGFEPSLYGIAVSVANHYTGWVTRLYLKEWNKSFSLLVIKTLLKEGFDDMKSVTPTQLSFNLYNATGTSISRVIVAQRLNAVRRPSMSLGAGVGAVATGVDEDPGKHRWEEAIIHPIRHDFLSTTGCRSAAAKDK
ncbi:uncharacterized protein TNCV_5086221 [Trichonephila clavipes]|uniref:Uncharacterized protein n=1 Tax=Trichonephila clavipes TaxID=2585209 RepID=A0A8X6SDU8_TRICX|nr:uncharacterized protein TNCV_5086221 [Trichonephila clavipes]